MSDPKFEVDEPVNVIGDGQVFPGTVLGIQFNVPVWWYIIGLDDPIESDYGPQRGLFVPESSLEGPLEDEESEPVIIESEWATVGSYVYACNQEQIDQGHPAAIDVEVRLVHDDQGRIYVQTVDELDGISFWDNLPYETQGQAESVAKEVIAEGHEAEPGENAEAYLARTMAEEQAESH
jgi:hypothetical protein